MRFNSRTLITIFLFCLIFNFLGSEKAMAATADHLLVSELIPKTRLPYTTFGSPFIEITNPTAASIDLSHVYITDGMQSPSALYYNITLSDPMGAHAGGGIGGDFHAKFPDGYILAAGSSLAIALNGSQEFFEAYGQQPDFELFEEATNPDAIAEMLEAFPGSINAGIGGGSNIPLLSDISESIMLYMWNGSDDLVQDLDYVLWGTNTAVRVDKSGVTVGTGSYLPDTPVGDQEPVGTATINFRQGYRRIGDDEGTETLAGGNGINGHDETSENLGSNWTLVDFGTDGHEPPVAPAFFHPSAPIVTGFEFFPINPYAGQIVELSVTAVSEGTITAVTFFASIDGGIFNPINGTNQGSGTWTAQLAAQAEGALVRWYAELSNSGGGISTAPTVAPIYVSAWTVDEAPDPSDYPTKLLITEVCTKGTTEEFIEVYNPSAHDVDMSDYYLSDAVYAPNDQGYWNIGSGEEIPNIGGGAYTDFQSRFPDGFVLVAGDTIVISIAGSAGFSASFGFLPDLELYEDDAFPDNVPDMRPVFVTADGNSIITTSGANPSTPTLTNNTESIQLYHYLEGDDLVTDIDLFIWGTSTSVIFSKTGKTIGSSTYLPDTFVGNQNPYITEADFGNSYQRVDGNEGTQITSGSNGVLGRDETSENLPLTFQLLPWDPAHVSYPTPAIHTPDELLPASYTLLPCHPNPFNPTTTIAFKVPHLGNINLEVFDVAGRKVRTLYMDETFAAGLHSVAWDGKDNRGQTLASGVYQVRLKAGDIEVSQRATLIK